MDFNFWIKYLKAVSLFMVLFGLFWAFFGSFDPLGLWDQGFAKNIFHTDTLSTDVVKAKRFILGILGATNAGYFILQYYIAKHAYANREYWSYQAILAGFSVWFIVDSVTCLYLGGAFNVLLANIPCLLLMLPVFFTKKYFDKSINSEK